MKVIITGLDSEAAATKGDLSPTSERYLTKIMDPRENLF